MADHKTDTPTAPAHAAKTETPAAARTDAPAATAKTADAPKADEAKPAKAAAEPAKAAAPAAKRARAAKPARTPRRTTAKAAAKAAKPAKAAPAARRAKPAARKAAAAATSNVKIESKRINRSINEGTQTMKKEANQMADRVQAAFGDYNERAKTAFDRNARFAEELTELSKGHVEALVASTKVAARGVETIGQEVAELSRKSFEEASATLRSFAEVKSPTDFFRLQGDFARGQFDTFVAESAKLSEAMIKLAGDVAQPLTNRYSVAAEKVKAAVAL